MGARALNPADHDRNAGTRPVATSAAAGGARRRAGDGPLGKCAGTAASVTTAAEGWR
jgi:hypothetical protein